VGFPDFSRHRGWGEDSLQPTYTLISIGVLTPSGMRTIEDSRPEYAPELDAHRIRAPAMFPNLLRTPLVHECRLTPRPSNSEEQNKPGPLPGIWTNLNRSAAVDCGSTDLSPDFEVSLELDQSGHVGSIDLVTPVEYVDWNVEGDQTAATVRSE